MLEEMCSDFNTDMNIMLFCILFYCDTGILFLWYIFIHLVKCVLVPIFCFVYTGHDHSKDSNLPPSFPIPSTPPHGTKSVHSGQPPPLKMPTPGQLDRPNGATSVTFARKGRDWNKSKFQQAADKVLSKFRPFHFINI